MGGREVLVVLFVALLAGCGGRAGADDEDDGLEATDSTGILHGVVVDDAVRPLDAVNITIQRGGFRENMTTGPAGEFGFDGLEPGGYTVTATRLGYVSVTVSATVSAGDEHPELVHILLGREAATGPFFTERKIDGFLECSAGIGNWCFILNYYPCIVYTAAGMQCTNLTSDDSFFVVNVTDLDRVPDWTQGELVWESTQSLFPYLSMRLDIFDTPPTIAASNSSRGPSPIYATLNRTIAEEYNLGTEAFLGLEAFSGGGPPFCDLNSRLCILTATVNQDITYYVHIFYGYTPPSGWRFTDGEQVPGPPA